MATGLYKKRKRRARRKSRNKAGVPTPAAARRMAQDRFGPLFLTAAPDFKKRAINHFRRFDVSKQTPTKPAYIVPFKNRNAVRSNSLGKRYMRYFRGGTRADCIDRPDPKAAGEARQKQRRDRERYGAGGRAPKAVQKIRRARKFRVWCQ